MRNIFVALTLLAALVLPAGAQQLTRFAVIDLPKVYTTFYRDSKAVRDFEERAARVQVEIDRMTTEIQDLQKQKLDAETAGDQQKALKLDTDISKKADFLKEYYRVKTAEIEDQRKKLAQSSDFLQQVYAEIKLVAESEGYSMVLNLKEGTSILWYSPTVDITDEVIQNLTQKAGR